MRRMQHVVPSGVITAVALWVAWISYTAQPAEAFLFPRLIATVFVALALWTFGKALLGLSRVGEGISRQMIVNIAPGLGVMILYIFWAANGLGFYTASALAFFALLSLYDPAPHGEMRSWIRRLVLTGCYVLVMYLLFAQVLNVFTPREVLFR